MSAAGLVSISPDDLDTTESVPAVMALGNLAIVHDLPRLEATIAVTKSDGHVVVDLVLSQSTAQAWRAALGAPEFTTEERPHYTTHKTQVMWLGGIALVRLTYSTL